MEWQLLYSSHSWFTTIVGAKMSFDCDPNSDFGEYVADNFICHSFGFDSPYCYFAIDCGSFDSCSNDLN